MPPFGQEVKLFAVHTARVEGTLERMRVEFTEELCPLYRLGGLRAAAAEATPAHHAASDPMEAALNAAMAALDPAERGRRREKKEGQAKTGGRDKFGKKTVDIPGSEDDDDDTGEGSTDAENHLLQDRQPEQTKSKTEPKKRPPSGAGASSAASSGGAPVHGAVHPPPPVIPGELQGPEPRPQQPAAPAGSARAGEAAGAPAGASDAGERRRGWGRATGSGANRPTWTCDVRGDELGQIKFDLALDLFTAHCNLPSHGRLCRLRRTIKPNARNLAQGRPAGVLLAWLAAADQYGNKEDHQAIGQRSRHEDCFQFERRVEARSCLAAMPELALAFDAFERPQRPGEAEEPEGWA